MRTNWKVSALSLVLVLGACGRREEQAAALPDDLKQDLAVAAAGGDLAVASLRYQRARFVSPIEQRPTAQRAARPRRAPHAMHAMVSHASPSGTTTEAAPEPAMDMTAEASAPVSTPAAESASEPTIVAAPQSAPDPVRSAGSGGSDAVIGDRDQGGGLGGLLGGIIGAVVIRGGHGGIDKCDPRREGRARPTIGDPPIFIQPTFPSPTFPRSRRR